MSKLVTEAIDTMRPGDWEQVRAIYLEGIATGQATFEIEAPSWEVWDAGHLSFARLVAREANRISAREANRISAREANRISGWAALSPVSARRAYAGVAEVSVYVVQQRRGAGVGRALLESLIVESERNRIWTLQAAVFPENSATIALHRRCGFREVGRRERISKLHGAWRDTILLERRSVLVGVD